MRPPRPPASLEPAQPGGSWQDAVFQANPVPLWIVAAGRPAILAANAAACRALGQARDAMDGRPLADWLHDEDRSALERLARSGVTDLAAARSRWRLRRRTGGHVTALVGPSILVRGADAHLLWALPASADRPGAGDWEPDDLAGFAFAAFHDLKEPLHLVEGYLDLVAEAAPEATEYIAVVKENTARMQSLVMNVLEYFRLQTRPVQPEPVALGDVVQEALGTLRLAIEEAGARVEVGPLPEALVDRLEMTRLFQNLISNAIKFRGDAPPRVVVGAERDGGQWVVTVQDNGIGVPPDHREKVFEPFHRLHSVDRFPGTGLGLSTCRRIIEAHGGRIWIDDAPEGTAVRFTVGA